MNWTLVVALSAGAYLFKVVGLLALDRRTVPATALVFVGLLPPALFAALIVVQTVAGPGGAVVVDARLAGLAAAAVAVRLRAPFLVVVASAMLTAAVLRAL